MCGRYTLTSPHDAVADYFGTGSAPELPARYNLAPTQESLIVTGSRGGKPIAGSAHWGFELGRGGKKRLAINARSESAGSRSAFRDSFRNRRCLVPANGFFEWARIGRTRQPFYFTSRASPLISFAGLWTEDEDGRRTYVIMTTAANGVVGRVHDRMPVLLDRDRHEQWLDPDSAPETLPEDIFAPWPDADMRSQPVGLRVNDVACDQPSCLEPLSGPVDLFTN